ncbi:Helix-turn-helix domain-containing protein [Flavobacterium gillisiae]|uniref:Helix-turn-helix domain-containing protein n=1 Tax=Flavobacterium gillisiae TaxID=150146 RepID=A0A1H3ZSP8_9FLAO|nr:response regulator [Flavobacterium gillisiae]SEA26431.1 Helix-turn-helix domain-containing protein [Flavobacterium gillisiae]
MKFKKKILLIEDDLNLGGSIVEIFRMSDFDVDWLKSGPEALIYLKKNTCAIIISDFMMPHMNGEEVLLEIRKQTKHNTIPFIIITANLDEVIKYSLLKNGINDYITKPFETKELIYKVRNLLDFQQKIIKKLTPDPFSKVTIKLSETDFITSLNEILSQNLKSKIDANGLATKLLISKSTLDKKIRKHTNKNTSQYRREFNLDYAIKLINLGETNIQHLVNETGFNSFSYFSTSFKSYVGMSATDYIKSIKVKD